MRHWRGLVQLKKSTLSERDVHPFGRKRPDGSARNWTSEDAQGSQDARAAVARFLVLSLALGVGACATPPAGQASETPHRADPSAQGGGAEASSDTTSNVEESVRPGVNDRYYEAGALEEYAAIFTGERRDVVEHKQAILEALQVEPGMRVADVGAGTGLFTFDLAQRVGAQGEVFAVDIAPQFLGHLRATKAERGATNVTVHEASPKDARLPAGSFDLIYMCDVYHHVEFPMTYMPTLRAALKEGGTLVLIDFEKVPGVTSPRMMKHVRAGKALVIEELGAAGFEVVEEADILDENYVLRLRAK